MHCRLLLIVAAGFLVAVLPAVGQTPAKSNAKSPFTVDFDPVRGVSQEDRADGKKGLHFTVRFTITRKGGTGDVPGKDYKVVVEEDGREVARRDVPEPRLSEELSAVLAIDISGSMAKANKENKTRIDQARLAAESFVKRLPQKADCGLILFDHEILDQDKVKPSLNRQALLARIGQMQPRGGTAYLDATQEGIIMLVGVETKGKKREKAVVIMTDGVDLHSKKTTLPKVIKLAKDSGVKVHTIGIGEPGTGLAVNSVLVLDHSQSMEKPADDADKRPKIVALHHAAEHFVNLMPDNARTIVLPFGDVVDKLEWNEDFSDFSKNKADKAKLIQKIKNLKPKGETAMLDAAYEAIAMLEARNLKGHRAVVVMTDGIDNKSRFRPEDVIERAKQAKVALHMLAFGRDSELSQAIPDMKRIAEATGGQFHHARNDNQLIRIFEDMSNALHDDGIDEQSLKKLATDTHGEYHHAKNIDDLKLILDRLSDELQKQTYTITFDSPRGHDGTVRRISVKLVRAGEVVEKQESEQAVHGVVIAEINPIVYLSFLGILGLLLVVPTTLGRMMRSK